MNYLRIYVILFMSFLQVNLIGQEAVEIHTPNSRNAELRLLPMGISGDSSSIFLGEDKYKSYGMFLEYDGLSNVFNIFGKINDEIFGPHITVERAIGNTIFGGNIYLNPEKTVNLKNAIGTTNIILDPANNTSGELKSRVTVDEIKLTSADGQIRSESVVDIFTFDIENATLRMLPTTTNSGDSASIFLAENRQGTVGMSWTYDGSGNEMELYGKSTFGDFGPHLRIHRDSGNAHIGDGSSWYYYDTNGNNTITLNPNHTPLPPLNTPRGRITTSELEITGGSDLVEFFDKTMDSELPIAGDLVSVSSDGQGRVLKTNAAYDSNVIGVISGANGVLPGLMLGQKNNKKVSGNLPVAIGGRAYIAVSKHSKKIKPGDRITSSEERGKCMKASEHIPGTIVGKALSFEENGFVLVLINLQ